CRRPGGDHPPRRLDRRAPRRAARPRAPARGGRRLRLGDLRLTAEPLPARRVLRGGRFTRVVSTGASVAASFFLPALRSGVPCHYIESATRTVGPSLT